jgi:hypothetical protein
MIDIYVYKFVSDTVSNSHILQLRRLFLGFPTVADVVYKRFVPAAGGEVGWIKFSWVSKICACSRFTKPSLTALADRNPYLSTSGGKEPATIPKMLYVANLWFTQSTH